MAHSSYETADLSKTIIFDGVEINPLQRIVSHILTDGGSNVLDINYYTLYDLKIKQSGYRGQTRIYTFKIQEARDKFTYELYVFKNYDMEFFQSYYKNGELIHDDIRIKNQISIYMSLISWNLVSDLDLRIVETI